MSTVQQIDLVHPFQRGLVDGYFLLNFSQYTPREIINLCIFYCFIFDEFAAIPPSKVQIIGINNEIVTLHPMNNTMHGATNCIFSRNVLKPSGRYHWSFKITKCKDTMITFGFIQNNKYIEGFRFCPTDSWTDSHRFDVYLDTDTEIAVYKINEIVNNYSVPLHIDSQHNIRLYLKVDRNPATIEMIAFHAAKWYMKRLKNKEDVTAHIEYARSVHEMDKKLKHYLIALKKYPLIESWNNEYLICLQQNKQYDVAFDHALKFKKGENGITKLIIYYYYRDGIKCYEKALFLSKLFDDETLKKKDLFFKIAYCYNKIKRDDINLNLRKNAVKYYQLYYDQHQYDSNDDAQQVLMICVGNMAYSLYSYLDDYQAALRSFLTLPPTEIDRRDFNGYIGYCYRKQKDYDNALKYYQLHLDKHPDSSWIHAQFYYTYHGRTQYDKANEYGLKALNFPQSDKAKESGYLNLGVNAYWSGDLEAAIKFSKQALQLNIPFDSRQILIYCNLAEYCYKLGEYEEGYQYILEAIKKDPNNVHVIAIYGILLYFMKGVDEAIIYLDKSLSNDQELGDPELLTDCLYIYAQILYDKNKYNESINKCLKAITMEEFDDYMYKYKVYHLMSINYEKLCEYDKSLEYLLKAKTLNPNTENEQYQERIESLQSILNSK